MLAQGVCHILRAASRRSASKLFCASPSAPRSALRAPSPSRRCASSRRAPNCAIQAASLGPGINPRITNSGVAPSSTTAAPASMPEGIFIGLGRIARQRQRDPQASSAIAQAISARRSRQAPSSAAKSPSDPPVFHPRQNAAHLGAFGHARLHHIARRSAESAAAASLRPCPAACARAAPARRAAHRPRPAAPCRESAPRRCDTAAAAPRAPTGWPAMLLAAQRLFQPRALGIATASAHRPRHGRHRDRPAAAPPAAAPDRARTDCRHRSPPAVPAAAGSARRAAVRAGCPVAAITRSTGAGLPASSRRSISLAMRSADRVLSLSLAPRRRRAGPRHRSRPCRTRHGSGTAAGTRR